MNSGQFSELSRPYKGLAAFDDSDLDALLFFGRARDTEVIAANLMASRLTVLYGPPGVGKSSVLHAGVARRLRSLAPDARVLVHDSWAGGAGHDALRSLAGTGDGYLLLDQFEEAFAYPDAEALAADVAQVITSPDLRINVLIALRDDALAALDVFTGRVQNVFGNYLSLERLDRAAAREAVLGPLERYNELVADGEARIEDELVEAVLDQVEVGRVDLGGPARGSVDGSADGGIEAPYLQLVMDRLWEAEHERGSPVLKRATLDELGGAQAIVRAHLDEAVGELTAEEQDVAADVFNHLVTPSGTKIAHGVDDLAEYAGVREKELEPVLESLSRNRILRPADGRFEIFHDVLADAVLAWRTRHEGERALAVQHAEAERRHRQLLALLASALVVLAVMAAVTIYALTQRTEAREQADAARSEELRASGNRLAAEASVLIPPAQAELDPELAMLLAAEAVRLEPTPRSVNILRRALLVSHLRAVMPERRVTSASFSPDGTSVLVGTEDGTAAIYSGDGSTKLTTLQIDGPVTGAIFSPDGQRVLTTERGGPARLRNAAEGTPEQSFGRAPTAASFSPDGARVVTAEPDAARVWRVSDGSIVATLRQPDAVRLASFSPDGELVTTVGTDQVARVFDASSGQLVSAIDHGGDVTSASITPNGRLLVTTGTDLIARIWAIREDGRLVRELRGHRGQITSGVVADDGALLVTTSTDGSARVWELPSGDFVAELVGHANRVSGAAFSRDSGSVVTWGVGGLARVGSPLSAVPSALLAGHRGAVTGASFDPSGEVVLTTSADGRARLWGARVDTELERVASVPAPVGAVSFTADGSMVAVSGRSGVDILETADGVRVAGISPAPARALAIHREASLVAAGNLDQVSVWKMGEDEPAGTIYEQGSTAVAFSPDGRRLAVGTEEGVIGLWTVDGERLSAIDGPPTPVASVAFSPTADRLAAGFGDGTLAMWDLTSGDRLYERAANEAAAPVTSVAFSPEGSRLVTAGGEFTARVWGAETGRLSYTLRGHSNTVRSAAFSPNGDWLVTTASGAAGIWDAATRQRLLLLQGEGGLLAASFNPTSVSVATVGLDGVLRSYFCQVCIGVDDLLDLAESRLAATGRELTAAERRHYLDDR